MATVPLERRFLVSTTADARKSLFPTNTISVRLSNPSVPATLGREGNSIVSSSSDATCYSSRAVSCSRNGSFRSWDFRHSSFHIRRDTGQLKSSTVNIPQFGDSSVSVHHLVDSRRDCLGRLCHALPTRLLSFSGNEKSITYFSARKHVSTVRNSKFPVTEFLLYRGKPASGSRAITTSLWMEGSKAPAYSKRRKKKRKGPHASTTRPVSALQEAQPVDKAEEIKSVVVVESPAKAKTIQKYLEGKYVVLPSFGHVRDLAAKAGSVRPDEDFKLVWEVPASARQHLNMIKAAVKGADSLFLASDPDREGEAIAWHVLEMLKMEGSVKNHVQVRRIVFNEITKSAVLRAMESPRDISSTLVEAYLARRALDYLIGFDLSPVLWRKLPGSKSAGRVQSAALRLVSEREMEMEAFVPREYWTIDAHVAVANTGSNLSKIGAGFPAKVTHIDGEKLSQFSLVSEEMARNVATRVQSSKFHVSDVKKSMVRRNPAAPYITSTLQQDASSKLGFGASRTMTLAQQLYEGVKLENDELVGLITYMRTDGVQMSDEAVQSIRSLVTERYGENFVPSKPRQFTSRAKNAQEAHEAIRPTDIHRLPSMLEHVLEEDELRLYSLIWRRTVACQMEQAIFAQVAVDIKNEKDDLQLRASGSSLSYPGYLAASKVGFIPHRKQVPVKRFLFIVKWDTWKLRNLLPVEVWCPWLVQDKAALTAVEGGVAEEDEDSALDDGKLWSIEAGDLLTLEQVRPNQHFTEPPPRFTEGSLVKRLEELGIGRPSTYASTLRTLVSRNYVKIEKRRIFPEPRGRMVSSFLSHYFPKFSDYEFTAKLEEQLDEISGGRANWKSVLMDFWPEFHEGVCSVLKIPIEEVVKLLGDVFSKQLFSDKIDKVCPSCGEGKMGLKLSRFGSGYFLGCSRYPACVYRTSVLSSDALDSSDDEGNAEPVTKVLGTDPVSGLKISLKHGPYGNYIQMGSGSKSQKPKRSAIPKTLKAEEITLPVALGLLKYPVELGKHPELASPVLLSVGQYGHFVRCRGLFVSLPKEVDPDSVSLEEAVRLLKSKHVSKRGRKPQAQSGESEQVDASPDKKSTSVKKVTNSKAKTVKAKKSTASTSTKDSAPSDKKETQKSSEKVGGKTASKERAAENVQSGNGNGIVEVKRPRGRPRKVRPEVKASAPVEELLEVSQGCGILFRYLDVYESTDPVNHSVCKSEFKIQYVNVRLTESLLGFQRIMVALLETRCIRAELFHLKCRVAAKFHLLELDFDAGKLGNVKLSIVKEKEIK
ncbi:hypothetical protein R1sor_010373 [Riccia sorocarpa]|uniref:DNA topoisomerase n=1 Tax=Riccia sorocarpa TaxID=122646 RepID=A0ABD3I1J0_9MARC